MALQVKFPFGKLVSVLVTHVEASGDFFVQINSEAGKLDVLMEQIEHNVLTGRAGAPNVSEIMVGSIYLAQYQEDSRWYRSRVLGVNTAEQQCEVFFVDYGNTDFVPLSCIRNAEEKFCELPQQSFECELEGIDRFRNQSFEETVALLNETIVEQELYCKAVQLKKNCVLVTQLFFDEKGTKSVFEQMQSGGLELGAEEHSMMSNGESTLPQQLNRKREVKYKTMSLPPDSFHDLSVTWVEDPSHFWCQLLTNTKTIAALMENLAEVYTNLEPAALPLQSCTVGYPCCAKFYEDDAWYRGVITNVSSIATGQIEVRFVDYGNSQDTELSDVRDLKDEFLKDPCQAMYFAIAGVDPASKDGMWADEAKVLFEKLINLKHVVGLVTCVENDGRLRVKLMDTTSDLDMELNQILIAANYGVKSADTPNSTTSSVTSLKSSQPAAKPVSQPVFAKENVQIGIEEKVLVTNIINPSKFYCQLFKNGPKLESLMQDIGRHYSRLGANEELLSSPSPGDPCCAQFSEDGCWYRAMVINSSPKVVTVQYIDYGNSETLPLTKIKKLIPKFSDLPQQGIECTLNRIKPRFVAGEPKWKPRDTETFMDLALEKEGKLKVVTQDSSGVCRVELVVRNRREDQNVSEHLLINGNAELADGALPASENYESLKSQTFPEPDLKVGHFEDVIVSYTEHPCNFWCQLQKSATQLDSLMTEIHDLYSSEGQRNSISNPACGMLCCAQFTEDNKWYRGKITGVKKGGLVEVHFVDYGNYEILPLARVKKLQGEFLKLPPQAVKCALAKISPTNKDLLSDGVMNRFEELTLDKELVMMADKFDEVSGTFAVVLLDTTEGKNLDIASDLQTIMSPSTMREKVQIMKAQIQPGTTERVFVSSATTPAKFFCQLLKTTASLDELMNGMFEYYEPLSPQQEQLSEPSVGEFCAAKFSLDDGWYRAKVLEVKGNSVSVFYIDYGNSETLSLSRLRVLNSKFQNLSSQAIECSLSGNFKGDSDDKFVELVLEKEFSAKVLNFNGGVPVVDLVSKDTNQSVCNILGRESAPLIPCDIAQLQWKTGETIDVFVPFAESVQKFFCQTSAHSSELDDLMNRLEECYNTNAETLSTPKAGSFCVAWYDGWYRAKVEQVQVKDVSVNFIDYGDTATVALDNIRTIKPEFCLLPAQAVQCCLKGFFAREGLENFKDLVVEQEFKATVTSARSGNVYEVDLVPGDGSASICEKLSKEVEMSATPSLNVVSIQLKPGEVIDVFIPFAESAQTFFCQVSQNSSDLDDLMTKLEEQYSSDQEILTSISVGTFCVAHYEDGGWYRAQVTGVQGESIYVFYIDYGDSATLPLSSIRSLKPEFSSLPAQAVKCSLKGYSSNQELENFKDLVIEQEFSAQVICVKSNGYEVQLASKDGSALFSKELSEMKTTAESMCSVPSIQLKPGDKVDVFIPFVESTQKFFCQVSQNSSDLDDLMNNLEEHYSSDSEIVTSISVGTFCVARYEDGGWYRAQVTGVQGESIDVFYIDYGDSATLPLSSIRSLKPEFSSLPAQAVKCSLKGYSSNSRPENFKDLVSEQEFEAQVTSVITQNTYEVELVSKDGTPSFISKTLAKDVETTQPPLCNVPSIQLKPGDKVDVFIPFVESAQKFFSQVSQNASELDDLMNKLEEHYSSVQESVTSVSAGYFCVAQYEDGGWYRAQVTKVHDESIDVFYIDYGDTATLPLSSIRSLRPTFSLLPAQAIKCQLKGCSTDDQPENFKNLVLEQEFQLQVTGSQQPGVYEVELFSKEGSKLFGETLPSKAENKEIGSPLLSGFNVGSFIQLCPMACVSPHQFHCHTATPEHKEKLSQLMDNLQEYYETVAEQEPGIANPVVGMNCAALFPDDEMWYRGRITKVVDSQFVEVFYVDFGNSETVPVSKVKTIKEEWTELPAQAIQCSLASISPVSGPSWPDAVVARFKNLTIQKMLVGKVIKKGSDNILGIELFDTTEQSVDINIGDLLVKEGLAICGTSKPVAAVKSYAALGKAKPAENEKVYVSAMESPGCFFCLVSGTEEKLMALMSEISSVYDSLSDEEFALSAISVGDVCCAQFSEDNQWYRAVVEDNTNGALTVRFIDYGNTETLPIGRTKILKDAFFAEPPLAVKCSLLGIKPAVGETWPDKSATLFEELTAEKELNAKFSSFTEPFEIQLNESGMDIGEELVKAKLAVTTQTAVEPIAQGKPTSGQYTNPVVECGQMYDVVMTHLSSPGKFFCQLVNMKEQLDGMMTDLNDHCYELAETEGCLVSPTVGQPCVGLFEDVWYRAEVLNISVNDMSVRYVDYGNEETLKPSGVKQITPLFLKTPKVAIECSLDLNRDEWPEDSTGIFEELTAGDEQLIIKILCCQGGRYEVKVFNKDASCFSAELLSTLKGAAQEVSLKEQALQLGQTEDVYVVHTGSSEDFYIQLSATYPQLEQMMAEIAEVYSGLADDVGHEDVVVGNPVCAQFSEDDSWYRAAIKSVPSDFEVEVHYVDYGNSEVILLSDIRQLSNRFFNLPVQAVRCSLDSPVVESFGQRVADKELKATFLSLEKGKWKVSLFDGVGKVGQIDVPRDSGDTFPVREFIQPAITPEMKEHVYVSHIVSPDEFYVQFESALDDLSALSGELSRFYLSPGPSTNVLRSPAPGMSCCARFSQDGDWYRGRIKRVTSSGAEVEFVDYGNSEVVSFDQVKDPEKDFMQLPRQAILCGLDATKDHWSAGEVNIFKSVALDKSFNAKFIIRDGQKWRLSLDSGGVSIVDMFMTKDAADLQQEGREISSIQVGRYAFPQVSSGQIEEVYVSHVTKSGDFYIQLSKSSADLETIENLVSEIYDQPGATAEAMEMCFVDSLCCARFSEDFKWYRALVTKVFSDTEVEVLFVDYGNTDSLHVGSMKQLRPELLKFPVQAVKCRLEGSKDIWTESDIQQFESKVLERPLHVTFARQEEATWFVTIQALEMFSSKARLTTKVRSFSKETLDVNKQEEAYFLFANSPDCFWLNLVRTGDNLIRLMDQIANEVTAQPLEKSQVKVGVPCLGMYTENDMWHRAQIVEVQDDAYATVSYIDYGNSETLPLERLHSISDSQLKLPSQGICCRLAGVQGVDPNKITNYLNEMLVEKVVEVEVQNQHTDGSYTVKLFHPGASLSINDQIVGECLGDTSLVDETKLEQASPPRLPTTQERITFKLPELQSGSKVPVSFVSAFLPAEMQLLLTERTEEQEQLTESITSMYNNLSENELRLDNPEVGMLCCAHFSEKWFRGEIISISADGTASVKLVDCGTHEKIPISELKSLKDELLEMPVFVLESSLANIHPSSEDGQWSPECSSVLESLCRSKALVAEITQVFGDMVELILNDESGKQINQSLVEMGYAKACDPQEDFFGEQPTLKWPELQIGQSLEACLIAAKDLESIQLQLDNPDGSLATMMEQLSVLYSNLSETEEVIGNPRVGQVCCAQFSEDHDWYRAVVTCVSEAGVEVKFVDYGNIDVALMVKQLREEFFSLPVQCIDCSLHGVESTSDKNEEIAAKLSELCESKKLKAEITNVSGDSVVVNLFYECGETQESVADVLVKLGFAHPRPTVQEEPRRISFSEGGKMVYNYPESGDDFVHNVSLISTSSPSEFWCQLVDSMSELKTLSDEIELFYQSLGENDLRVLYLQVGDTCCAQFTDDNKWCRSQVNKVCSDGQVCVRSVDYVKQETLTLDRIKKLDPGFAVLPVQALCCSLAGIEPPHKYYEEDWSSNAVERFQELCHGKDVKIKIKETVGDVTLVDLLDSTGLSISNQLLLEGLAVEVKSPLTESPVKDVLQKQDCLSSEQEGEVDKDSSEENIFEEALSSIEGVEALTLVEGKTDVEDAKGDEDEDEDDNEEEFLDSNDQVIEDVTEVSEGHKCDEGVPQATEEDGQAVKNEEEKQKDENKLQSAEEQEEQTIKDVENNDEEDENSLQVTDKQEMDTVESDEKTVEEGEDKLQAANILEDMDTESDEKKQEGTSVLQATEEPEEQAVKEGDEKPEGQSGSQTAEEQEVQTYESDQNEQGGDELQSTEEQGEQAVKEDEIKQEGESGLEQTAEEIQREEISEDLSSPVSKSELEEVDTEDAKEVMKEVEGCESKEQAIYGEVPQEETKAQTGEASDLSKDAECLVEEKVNNTETSEAVGDAEKSGKEEHEGPKMEEVSEEKERRNDEQEKELVESEDVLTEAFSEEDLSAITGSAGETAAETLDVEKGEEERLKESNIEEGVKQTSEAEESAKLFLEELLRDVCGSIDQQKSEYMESENECDAEATQDISKIPFATEQQEEFASSNVACCDDVDDNVLSDEALDKLDKELEAESSDEMELGVNRTGDVLNGTGEEEIHEVVKNEQDTECQTDISDCLDSKLSVTNGNSEVGNY